MILMLGTGLIKGAIPSALWKTGFTTGHSPRTRRGRAVGRKEGIMAKILDVKRVIAERFTAFAEEYLGIPPELYENGVIRSPHIIIGYLVEKGVFTMEEIRLEMKARGVYLGEDIYKKALVEIEIHR